MSAEEEQLREALSARRWRFGGTLALIAMSIFVVFLLMVGFARPLLGTFIAPGLTVGVLLGLLLLLGAWIVTGIYVYWANHVYDLAAQQSPTR